MTPVTWVLAPGLAAVAAGALAAAAVSAASRERLLGRLGTRDGGLARPGPAPPRAAPAALVRHARARAWPRGPWSLAAALVGAGLLGAAAGFRLLGPVGGLLGAAAGPVLVEAALARRVEALRAAGEAQFREAVGALAAGLRAGLSVRRALAEAAREAEPPLSGALRAALRRLEVGEPLGRAVEGLAADLGTPDARLLATVLEIHARSGGDLPAHLDEVHRLVGRRVEARRQLRALTAQGRASGAVLAVLPVAFVGLLSGTSGNGLGAFYRTPAGAGLLGAGALLEALGFLWIRRITRGR